MNVLFLGRRYAYFRNFDSVIRSLSARGHAVHLAVERDETSGGSTGGRPLVEELATLPGVTFGEAPVRADDEWGWVASRLRLGLDYLRYQHRLFDDAPKLRARARERTPGAFAALGDGIRRAARPLRVPAAALIRRAERAVPDDGAIRAFLEERRPDLVLLTPLIDLGSSQIDYLRAARAMGIPTALCVWSWDHLSSKALIREWPDRVFVWNDTQKREATRLHRVPARRIVVTGAQCFDQWFGRAPSRDRATFCRPLGLPGDRPFLLYVCSALFQGSPPEAPFVLDWIARVRASALPALASAPILVRPHPGRAGEWDGVDVARFGHVAVWGGNPMDTATRNDYFDSLYHSAAVAGLNTSAFIEAGIVGRPVHTILLPEFHDNQMGTVHFRYLLEAGGGLLNVASSWDEHLRQLGASLRGVGAAATPFVQAFVRPRGIDVAATPVFVQEVEAMRGLRPEPAAADPLAPLWRRALARAARTREDRRLERWVYSERELQGIVRLREFAEAKAREKDRARAEKDARLAAHRAAKRAGRPPEITHKLG
jgi:hypothetical protein